MAFIACYVIAFVVAIIFQCNPISGVWDRVIEHTCINMTAIVYSSAGISVFQDLLILILPIPELLNLQVSFRKKINVMIMFGVGTLYVTMTSEMSVLPLTFYSAFATSCIRLKYLVAFGKSLDSSCIYLFPIPAWLH
jgi:hypothetical protein